MNWKRIFPAPTSSYPTFTKRTKARRWRDSPLALRRLLVGSRQVEALRLGGEGLQRVPRVTADQGIPLPERQARLSADQSTTTARTTAPQQLLALTQWVARFRRLVITSQITARNIAPGIPGENFGAGVI